MAARLPRAHVDVSKEVPVPFRSNSFNVKAIASYGEKKAAPSIIDYTLACSAMNKWASRRHRDCCCCIEDTGDSGFSMNSNCCVEEFGVENRVRLLVLLLFACPQRGISCLRQILISICINGNNSFYEVILCVSCQD